MEHVTATSQLRTKRSSFDIDSQCLGLFGFVASKVLIFGNASLLVIL
jgi:hypothetical protein